VLLRPAVGLTHRLRGVAAERRDPGGHGGPAGQHPQPGAVQRGRGGVRAPVERYPGGRAARLVVAPVGPVAAVLYPQDVVQRDPGQVRVSRNAPAAGVTSASGP
jgi:hypothetical protein